MHGWSWQRQATMRPQRCAVFPHVNNGAFIDTGITMDTWDPHIYISAEAAQELGKFAGMVPGEALKNAQEATVAANQYIAELEAKVTRLEEFKSAVELIKAG